MESSMEDQTFREVPISALIIHPIVEALSSVNEAHVAKLTMSMQTFGFQYDHPLRITPHQEKDHYWVLDGRHRLLAATAAGLLSVPILIEPLSQSQQLNALFIGNTIINGNYRNLCRPQRIINSILIALVHAQSQRPIGQPWTHARVSKTHYYQIKNQVEGFLTPLKENHPDATEHQLLYKAISDSEFSPCLYALYHDIAATETPSSLNELNIKDARPATPAILIRALKQLLRVPTLAQRAKDDATELLQHVGRPAFEKQPQKEQIEILCRGIRHTALLTCEYSTPSPCSSEQLILFEKSEQPGQHQSQA